MNRCTHDSRWHKEMKPCSICGAEHSDEEVEAVSRDVTRTFSAEQLEFLTYPRGEDDE